MLTKIYKTLGSETVNFVIHSKSSNQKVGIMFLLIDTIHMGLHETKRNSEFWDGRGTLSLENVLLLLRVEISLLFVQREGLYHLSKLFHAIITQKNGKGSRQ